MRFAQRYKFYLQVTQIADHKSNVLRKCLDNAMQIDKLNFANLAHIGQCLTQHYV
jgi:hypothetical protein